MFELHKDEALQKPQLQVVTANSNFDSVRREGRKEGGREGGLCGRGGGALLRAALMKHGTSYKGLVIPGTTPHVSPRCSSPTPSPLSPPSPASPCQRECFLTGLVQS